MEGDHGRAWCVAIGVRWRSVHCEIGGLDSGWVRGIAQVDDEVHRLGVDHTVASRVSGGHGKTDELSVGEGILLGLAADGHAPVIP